MVVMLMTTMVLLTIMMAVPVAVLAQAGSPRATLLIERLPPLTSMAVRDLQVAAVTDSFGYVKTALKNVKQYHPDLRHALLGCSPRMVLAPNYAWMRPQAGGGAGGLTSQIYELKGGRGRLGLPAVDILGIGIFLNDLLDSGKEIVEAYPEGLDEKIGEMASQATALGGKVFALVGGARETWGYPQRYDVYRDRIVGILEAKGVACDRCLDTVSCDLSSDGLHFSDSMRQRIVNMWVRNFAIAAQSYAAHPLASGPVALPPAWASSARDPVHTPPRLQPSQGVVLQGGTPPQECARCHGSMRVGGAVRCGACGMMCHDVCGQVGSRPMPGPGGENA